jgi:hypothetical protein
MPFDKSAMTSRTNRASNQSARTGRSIVLTERSQEIVSLTKQREDLQAQLAAIESTLHEKERVQLQLGKSRPHRPFAMLPRSARRFVEEEEEEEWAACVGREKSDAARAQGDQAGGLQCQPARPFGLHDLDLGSSAVSRKGLGLAPSRARQ